MQVRLPLEPESAPVVDGAPAVYFVRHQRARRYLVRVEPQGRVRVTIPRGGSKREAEAFLVRQRTWIRRQLSRSALTPPLTAVERDAVRLRAQQTLPAELLALAERHGLAVARVTVRNQRSRWGSCGRDGHITLNWRLAVMPDWVREYVLVHELMHLRRLDHSPDYWALVSAACPAYLDARAWLRAHGPALL